jgi:hypothetical protein
MHQVVEKASFTHVKLLALVSLLGLVALAGGCAAFAALPLGSVLGSPNSAALQIQNSTEIRLQEKNFIVIRTNMVGQASGFSLLGILTIVPARFTTAMNRLYADAQMKEGRPQTLANLVMEQDSSYFILFSIPKTSIRADVIEFTPASPTDLQPRPPPAETNATTR